MMSPSGANVQKAFEDCMTSNSCWDPQGKSIPACLEAHCMDQFLKCFSGCKYQTCVEMMACLMGCEDQVCTNTCFDESTVEVQKVNMERVKCLHQACPACSIGNPTAQDNADCNACASGAFSSTCKDQWTACAPSGDQYNSCTALSACINVCPDDVPGTVADELGQCIVTCEQNSSIAAQIDRMALLACLFANCPICKKANPTGDEDKQCIARSPNSTRCLGWECLPAG
jgi:hypothetical protein